MKRLLIYLLTICGLISGSCSNECVKVTSTHPNGSKEVEKTFPNCKDTSVYIHRYYFENGQIGSEGMIVNGVDNGEFRSWTDEGILTAIWNMVDGKGQGFVECWHENGVKMREINVVNGLRHGFGRDWDEEGNLLFEGFFKNDLQDSIWKFYDKDSWRLRNFINDTLEGYTYEYYNNKNGITHVVGQFYKGEETGVWKWFNYDSILYQTANYVNGLIEGEFIGYFSDGNINFIYLYENDSLVKNIAAFDKNGNQTLKNGNGKLIQYDKNGNVSYTAYYKNDKRTGIAQWFHDNGHLEQSALYRDGLRIEVLESYDRNGNKLESGTLKGGNGSWILYDKEGNVRSTKYYEKGVLVREEKSQN